MDLRNSLTMLALALGAAASGGLLLRNTSPTLEAGPNPRLAIGYYVNQAKLSGTGDDGRILYRLSAVTASQNFDDDMINMQQVHLIYDPVTDIPWDLRANTGMVPRDGNIIQLTGNVVAKTTNDSDAPMVIRTNYLELDTETYIANTEHKVAIDYSGNRVFATGMRAYFKEDRLQLISNVNGKFIP